jgi:hypothetical protein
MGFFNDVTPQKMAEASEGFKEFKIGDNEAFIKAVTEKTSESGNPMLQIIFGNDEGAEVRHYIVDGEYKMQKLKQLYQSFNIPFNNINPQSWIGKRGIVVCKAGEPYNGKVYNKVNFLRPLIQGSSGPSAPAHNPQPQKPFQIPDMYQTQKLPPDDDFEDDIPF